MTNTATPNDIARSRRIRHAQEAKAEKMLPAALAYCQTAGIPAEALAEVSDAIWFTWAKMTDAAGPKGEDSPSADTRGMVIDLVEDEWDPEA